MTDIERIVWGGLAGVTVYVVGQLLSKFLLEPLYELRKEIGNTRFNLAFHAAVIHTPAARTPERSESARQALLDNSSNIIAKLYAVRFYTIVRYVGALPSRGDTERAAVLLRGLSTYVHELGDKANDNIDAVNRRVSKIETLLRLKPLE